MSFVVSVRMPLLVTITFSIKINVLYYFTITLSPILRVHILEIFIIVGVFKFLQK